MIRERDETLHSTETSAMTQPLFSNAISAVSQPQTISARAAGAAVRPTAQPDIAAHSGDQIVPARPQPSDLRAVAMMLAGGVSNVAKGEAANQALPQHYRLKAVEPEAARGKTTNAMIVDTTAGRIKGGKPVGNWVVRTDAPHRGAPTHHVNIQKELIGGKDPHTPISAGAYQAAGAAARMVESVEKVALPVGIAFDAARLGDAYLADGDRVGTQMVQTGAESAGGWAGAAAGAAGGAEGGAALGGAIGALFAGAGAVPGAAIGGVAGGIAGGIAGAFAGSIAGEHIVAAVRH